MEGTNFFSFASGFKLEIVSKLWVGACIFSFFSGLGPHPATVLDLCGPWASIQTILVQYVSLLLCLEGFAPLVSSSPSVFYTLSPIAQRFLRSERKDLVEIFCVSFFFFPECSLHFVLLWATVCIYFAAGGSFPDNDWVRH